MRYIIDTYTEHRIKLTDILIDYLSIHYPATTRYKWENVSSSGQMFKFDLYDYNECYSGIRLNMDLAAGTPCIGSRIG